MGLLQYDELQIVNSLLYKMSEQSNLSTKTLKQCSEKALEFYLNGDALGLANNLAQITKLKSKLNSQPVKANKFAYQLNFEQQEQQQPSRKQKKPKPRMQANIKSEYCCLCPDNEQMSLLSASNYVYLGLPKVKTFRRYHHFILAPVDHLSTLIGADDVILQEIKNFQKCLIQMLEKLGFHAIFIQQYYQKGAHVYIQCLGVPLKKAYDFPFFFKQALENVEGFWNTHKQIIEIRKQKGGIQKQIPKQIKYFYIDFGLGYGYAHAIEDQKYWNKNFCYQIVAAALSMQSFEVKTTEEFGENEQQLKIIQFHKNWKQYDWTVMIDQESKV